MLLALVLVLLLRRTNRLQEQFKEMNTVVDDMCIAQSDTNMTANPLYTTHDGIRGELWTEESSMSSSSNTKSDRGFVNALYEAPAVSNDHASESVYAMIEASRAASSKLAEAPMYMAIDNATGPTADYLDVAATRDGGAGDEYLTVDDEPAGFFDLDHMNEDIYESFQAYGFGDVGK